MKASLKSLLKFYRVRTKNLY
uniref:Uncharacterized protein n=1 Tax=Rhizophora mucronata TaxID=61149 RepID=A0A2P2MU44_RHIMU